MRFELSVSDGEYKTGKVEPTIGDARKTILSLAYLKALEIYGNPMPDGIQRRIEYERELMDATFTYDQFLIHREMIRLSNLERGLFSYRGSVSNSFIAFLCGLTEINPIKSDFHLRPELMFGIRKRKKPQFEINVPAFKVADVRLVLDKLPGVGDTIRAGSEWGIHPCMTLLIPDGYGEASDWFEIRTDERGYEYAFVDAPYAGDVVLGVSVIADEYLDVLSFCEKKTKVPVLKVPFDDEDTLTGICDSKTYTLWDDVFKIVPEHASRVERLLETCKPKCFMDLVKFLGVVFSIDSAYGNTVNRLEWGTDSLSDTVTSFEDCYEHLLGYGIGTKKALAYADRIHWGKFDEISDEMRMDGIPDEFMERCEKIRYASPRAHMIQMAIKFWRLAYYMMHFPDDYHMAIDAFVSDPPEE